MDLIKTTFKDLFVIKPKIFEDARGYFFESFNKQVFKEKTSLNFDFVQDNESFSEKNVIRGLHFQKPPYAQDKLVRVIRGSVLDVIVDLRKNQPTYGKSYAIELSERNKLQLFIPKGFAHGFKTLENNTIFYYKCTEFYNKEFEDCILWNDHDLGINWDIENPIISEKDLAGKPFKSFISSF